MPGDDDSLFERLRRIYSPLFGGSGESTPTPPPSSDSWMTSGIYAGLAGLAGGAGVTAAKAPFLNRANSHVNRLLVEGKGIRRNAALRAKMEQLMPGLNTASLETMKALNNGALGLRNLVPGNGYASRILRQFLPGAFGPAYYGMDMPGSGIKRNTVVASMNNPAFLAHEMGHAMNARSVQRRFGNRGSMAHQLAIGPLSLLGSTLGSGMYMLGGESGREHAWKVPLLAYAPRLLEEGLASIRGYRRYGRAMGARGFKGKLGLLKAFGTYLAEPLTSAAGLYAAHRIQDRDKYRE
jgi:hypothetical protein